MKRNVEFYQKYINKLFNGIDRMKVSEEQNKKKIQGVNSQIGNEIEELHFEKDIVELRREQNVEIWLKKLEDTIKRNIQGKLATFISK